MLAVPTDTVAKPANIDSVFGVPAATASTYPTYPCYTTHLSKHMRECNQYMLIPHISHIPLWHSCTGTPMVQIPRTAPYGSYGSSEHHYSAFPTPVQMAPMAMLYIAPSCGAYGTDGSNGPCAGSDVPAIAIMSHMARPIGPHMAMYGSSERIHVCERRY